MQIWRSSRTEDRRWYLGVLCEHCDSPILFSLDRSEGHGEARPCVKLVLTCSQPDCQRKADYSGAEVSRYQKGDLAAGTRAEAR
jgi:hypothetical protein